MDIQEIHKQIEECTEHLNKLKQMEQDLLDVPPTDVIGKYLKWKATVGTTYVHVTSLAKNTIGGRGYFGVGSAVSLDTISTSLNIARVPSHTIYSNFHVALYSPDVTECTKEEFDQSLKTALENIH